MANEIPEDEQIAKLGTIIETLNAVSADNGACVYTAGSSTYCNQLTKSQCDQLKGIWTKGGKCP